MGNKESKTEVGQIELHHPSITFVRFFKKANDQIMQTSFRCQQKDYNEWANILRTSDIQKTQYLLIPLYHQYKSLTTCGFSGQIQVDYESFPYLLSQEIQNRRGKKKRFDQTQLWLILFCLIQAHNQMNLYNKSRVGDIRPSNIFLNQKGQLKVANVLSWPKQLTNFQKFMKTQLAYLSPQQIKLINQQYISDQEAKCSESFSIGLTILSAANLTDYLHLYNPVKRQFNEAQFIKIINEWKLNEHYSDIFKATICSLLELQLEQRTTQQQLYKWIQRYRGQILSRRDYTIDDPHKKVIRQAQMIKTLSENIAFRKPNNFSSMGVSKFGLHNKGYAYESYVIPQYKDQISNGWSGESFKPLNNFSSANFKYENIMGQFSLLSNLGESVQAVQLKSN